MPAESLDKGLKRAESIVNISETVSIHLLLLCVFWSEEDPLYSSEKQQNKQYYEYQTNPAAWVIAPVSTVRIGWQRTNQKQNQHNK